MSLELNWQLKIEVLGGKFSNVTFFPKTSRGIGLDRTRTSSVIDMRVSALEMARSGNISLNRQIPTFGVIQCLLIHGA